MYVKAHGNKTVYFLLPGRPVYWSYFAMLCFLFRKLAFAPKNTKEAKYKTVYWAYFAMLCFLFRKLAFALKSTKEAKYKTVS